MLSSAALLPRKRGRTMSKQIPPFLGCLAAGLVLAALGCSDGIPVRKAGGPGLYAAWRASVSESDELSSRTLQTLRRWDLEGTYRKHPADAHTALHEQAVQHPNPDLL